jgi:hypothetical protein
MDKCQAANRFDSEISRSNHSCTFSRIPIESECENMNFRRSKAYIPSIRDQQVGEAAIILFSHPFLDIFLDFRNYFFVSSSIKCALIEK